MNTKLCSSDSSCRGVKKCKFFPLSIFTVTCLFFITIIHAFLEHIFNVIHSSIFSFSFSLVLLTQLPLPFRTSILKPRLHLLFR